MAALRRQALVEVVTGHDAEGFLKLLADHRSRKEPFSLDEVLAELPRSQLDTLWESLLAWVTAALDSLIPEDDQDVEPGKEALVSAIVEAGLCTLEALPAEDGTPTPVPGGLLQTAAIVSALLLSLDEVPALDDLCQRISRLAELWWGRRLPEAAAMAQPALCYLLQLAVDTEHKTTRPLVQRICALLPCLSAGALSGAGSGRLRQLLCAAAQCPGLLAWDEGVRLVADVLGVPGLRTPAHNAIKAVLPGVTKQQALRYGQAYYRAWRNAQPADRESLEEQCLQDLMYHAVHASRAPGCRLARLLYQLLHHVHGQRRHRETAEMLVRLYQPILWRALSAPNETVQVNATFVLLDLFPLESPGDSRDARDAELARQSRLLTGLLQDTSHLVRATAAKGVSRALSQYWDIIPQDCLKQMLKVLLQELAYDAASVEVRQQVVTGISVVLENPYTHAYMKSALPFLADAFHDVHLSVRVAMCDLLLKVKQIKNIRYFDVVPVKHLLARLAMDEPPVCRRIVQLMVNSFFPAGESDETLLTRCICLIQENREASRRFYQHSEKVLTVEDAVRLMVAIRQALTLHARRQQAAAAAAGASAAGRRRHSAASATAGSDKENSTAAGSRPGKRRLHNVDDRSVLSDASQESTSSSDDSQLEEAPAAPAAPASPLDKDDVVLGLVDVTAVLWTSRLAELAQRPELLERLQQAWGRVLPLLFSQHRNAPAGGSLLYLASLLPHGLMAPLASHCLSGLRRMSEDATVEECAALLDPLINWGRCDDVLELCSERLQAAFDGERSFVASQKNQRRSAAGVRFRDPRRGRPKPRLALRWLTHLFAPSLRRHVLTTKYSAPLRELMAWMAAAIPAAAEERLAAARPDAERDELVAELVRALVLVSLALAAAGGPEAAAPTAALTDLLTWGRGVATAPPERWPNSTLLRRLCSLLADAAVNTTLAGCVSSPLAEASLQWLLAHLSTPGAAPERCLSTLFHATDLLEAVSCRPTAPDSDSLLSLCCTELPRLTGAAVGQLLRLAGDGERPTPPSQLAEVTSLLRALLTGWRRIGQQADAPLRDLAAVLTDAAQQRIGVDKLQGSTAAPTPELSPLVTALLSPLWRDEAGARLLTAAVEEMVTETADGGNGGEEAGDDGSRAQETAEQTLSKVVTAGYILHAIAAAKPSAAPHCRAAASAALVAARRISDTPPSGDDAAPQHFSAAQRLLEELAGRG